MERGFIPISLERYVELHIQANPGTDRADLLSRLRYAMNAHARGVRCECGEPIWMIGSAEVGLSCFTCITGEAVPDDDYEIVAGGTQSTSGPSQRARRKAARRRAARLSLVPSEKKP